MIIWKDSATNVEIIGTVKRSFQNVHVKEFLMIIWMWFWWIICNKVWIPIIMFTAGALYKSCSWPINDQYSDHRVTTKDQRATSQFADMLTRVYIIGFMINITIIQPAYQFNFSVYRSSFFTRFSFIRLLARDILLPISINL